MTTIHTPTFFSTKSSITAWLDEVQIKNYTLIPDLQHGFVVDVEGHVNLSNIELGTIPVQFNHVSKDFFCLDCGLTSLQGAPRSVGLSFSCRRNKLISLRGGPQSVQWTYNASGNALTDLDFLPEKLNGDFYCSHNAITSLKGLPEKIGGDFYCCNNALTSLEHCAREVGGKFWCAGNQLKNLEFCPDTVGGDFWCEENDLDTLLYFPRKLGGNVDMSANARLGDCQTITKHSEIKKIAAILKEQALMSSLIDRAPAISFTPFTPFKSSHKI